jgi:hypothetical protein
MPAPLDPVCIFDHLGRHNVDYVLIGGLAGVLHGSPAMTNDADIVPSADPANLERLAAALRELNARLRVEGEPEGIEFDPHPALLASLNILNMTTNCGDLDLTFTPAAYEAGYDELVKQAVVFEIDAITVKAAALSDVIRSKEAADRPKDHVVLPILHALQQEIELRDRRQ